MARRNLSNGEAVPMEPGERNRAVKIQQLTQSIDSSGAPENDAWSTLVSRCWMLRDDLSQRERFAADQISAPADTRWEMGYRADMDPELLDVPTTRRLLYKDRPYDIVSASVIGHQEGIELITLAKSG